MGPLARSGRQGGAYSTGDIRRAACLQTQRRLDRAAFRLLFVLFLTTGLGLIAYMNFKPGYSIGYGVWPSGGDHEVRERDYFFVVSFIVWGLWVGIGLTDLARRFRPGVAVLALLPALLPAALNAPEATRRGTPDATLAADFAYDLLNTAPPYGVLFTYGDNDTFPLWWAQEVEGIRQDVAVVCLALANTGGAGCCGTATPTARSAARSLSRKRSGSALCAK